MNEIIKCRLMLQNLDYKVLKYIEGELPEKEFEEVKKERKALRDKINELENLEKLEKDK